MIRILLTAVLITLAPHKQAFGLDDYGADFNMKVLKLEYKILNATERKLTKLENEVSSKYDKYCLPNLKEIKIEKFKVLEKGVEDKKNTYTQSKQELTDEKARNDTNAKKLFLIKRKMLTHREEMYSDRKAMIKICLDWVGSSLATDTSEPSVVEDQVK